MADSDSTTGPGFPSGSLNPDYIAFMRDAVSALRTDRHTGALQSAAVLVARCDRLCSRRTRTQWRRSARPHGVGAAMTAEAFKRRYKAVRKKSKAAARRTPSADPLRRAPHGPEEQEFALRYSRRARREWKEPSSGCSCGGTRTTIGACPPPPPREAAWMTRPSVAARKC